MNNRKAISIIEKQIVKLDQDNFNHPTWNIQTTTYLEKFFGNGSDQHKFFFSHFWNVGGVHNEGVTIEAKKHIAAIFLRDCIDTIDDIGLRKLEPKGNFISRMPDSWAVAIILGLVGFSFWLGNLSYPYLNQ